MQISRLPLIQVYPAPGLDPSRDPPDRASGTPSPEAERERVERTARTARPVDEARQVEQFFERKGAREFVVPPVEDPRNRYALETYQAVRDGRERD